MTWQELILATLYARSGKNWFLPFDMLEVARTSSCNLKKRSREGPNQDVMGSGENRFLPLDILAVARNGSCHLIC